MWRFCVAALLAAFAQPASADLSREIPPPLRAALSWSRGPGAESCIDERDLRAAVERRLGRTVFVSSGHSGEVAIKGRVVYEASEWRATVTMLASDGEWLGVREIAADAKSCRALDDSLAIVLAVMIDLPARDRIRLRIRAESDRADGWSGYAAVEGRGVLGLLPGLAFGWGLTTQLDAPILGALELTGGQFFNVEAETNGAGAEFRGWYAAIGACPRLLSTRAVRGYLCLGGHLAGISTRAFGLDVSRNPTRLMLSLEAAGLLQVRIAGPLSFHGRVGASTPIIGSRFTFEEPDGTVVGVHRVSTIGGFGAIGVGIRIE